MLPNIKHFMFFSWLPVGNLFIKQPSEKWAAWQRHSNFTQASLQWKPIFRIWVAPTQYLLSEDFHQSHINGRVLWVIFQPLPISLHSSSSLYITFSKVNLLFEGKDWIISYAHQSWEEPQRGQYHRQSLLWSTKFAWWNCGLVIHVHICCLGVVPIEF